MSVAVGIIMTAAGLIPVIFLIVEYALKKIARKQMKVVSFYIEFVVLLCITNAIILSMANSSLLSQFGNVIGTFGLLMNILFVFVAYYAMCVVGKYERVVMLIGFLESVCTVYMCCMLGIG